MENYRSLRHLIVPLTGLNVVTGPNGSGKSSLYRALRLLADGARNGVVAALAREGGLPATLWAGPETIGRAVRDGTHPVQGTARSKPVALRLGFGAEDYGYAIDLGLPSVDMKLPPHLRTAFGLDPEIKRETIWTGAQLRPSAVLCDRLGGFVKIRGDDGDWLQPVPIRPYDSMLSEIADPERAPEVLGLRDRIRSWRFYDHFRTDAQAPARRSQIGTRTLVLSHDGADLAAALQTVNEMGDAAGLEVAVEEAFPGSQLGIDKRENGVLAVQLRQHGLLRPLGAEELSDGTLRYLLMAAALLSPRPASLLVLNEPETSLHADLLPALAGLIVRAAAHTQVVVVSHARLLIEAISALEDEVELTTVELAKEFGETVVAGREPLDGPPWTWPKR